jgi:hypothetical protein
MQTFPQPQPRNHNRPQYQTPNLFFNNSQLYPQPQVRSNIKQTIQNLSNPMLMQYNLQTNYNNLKRMTSSNS